MTDGEQPDADFDKTENRRKPPFSPGDENHPDRAGGNNHSLGKEDDNRQNPGPIHMDNSRWTGSLPVLKRADTPIVCLVARGCCKFKH